MTQKWCGLIKAGVISKANFFRSSWYDENSSQIIMEKERLWWKTNKSGKEMTVLESIQWFIQNKKIRDSKIIQSLMTTKYAESLNYLALYCFIEEKVTDISHRYP